MVGGRLASLRLAPDGRPRPDAPFGRGPLAARVLAGVIRAAAAGGGRLPAGMAHRLAHAGGTLEWAIRPGKRRVLAENLARAVGEPPDSPAVRALVRDEVRNEARRSADLLWALGRPAELLVQIRVEGRAGVDQALAGGQGVILAGPHVGGWEVVSAAPAALLPVPLTVIVTDDWLAWAIAGMRLRAGLRLVFGADRAADVARRLRAGEAALVLGDIAPPGVRTLEVSLLGQRVRLPAGVASLARISGATIVPLAVLPIAPRAWRIVLGEPVAAPARRSGTDGERAALQALADRWSQVLRAHPAQWAAVYPLDWLPGADPQSGAVAASG
jgi:lauroyl/myristoyl acyltransferase